MEELNDDARERTENAYFSQVCSWLMLLPIIITTNYQLVDMTIMTPSIYRYYILRNL